MKKKSDIVLWVIVIIAVLAAAYTLYVKLKPQTPAGDYQWLEQKVKASDFSIKDMSGKNVSLSDYKGRIVVLNFWTTWCVYCKQEMPDLDGTSRELDRGKEAVVLAVDVKEESGIVKSFLDNNKYTLHVLLDTDSSIAQTYGISGFPTTVFIDGEGMITAYIPHATDRKTIKEVIDRIKKQ